MSGFTMFCIGFGVGGAGGSALTAYRAAIFKKIADLISPPPAPPAPPPVP